MRIVRPLLCSCLALLACAPASAQTGGQNARPERPYRGVFASGVDQSGGQSLTASASVSGGYDDNILADATQQANLFRQGQQGTLGQFSGNLNYSLSGAHGSVDAGAGTSLRYYPSLTTNQTFETYNANITGTWIALTKPRLTFHQTVGYQPFSFLSDLSTGTPPVNPIDLVPPQPDFVPVAEQYVSYDGGADLDWKYSPRNSVFSSYNYHAADRTANRTWRQIGTVGTSFGLTRDMSLRLSYRRNEAHYTNRVVITQSPDVGFDFNHALSLTRRTSLSFGIGLDASSYNGMTRYRANGKVNVTHEIGRSWALDGSYNRGTFFTDTMSEPVFGDTAVASLSGLFSRRIQFDATASATVGSNGFNTEQKFDHYQGTVTLSTALNRFMNVGVDYAYYRYKFDQGFDLEPGVPRNTNRQSIRAHLSVWAPILNNTRRRNATR